MKDIRVELHRTLVSRAGDYRVLCFKPKFSFFMNHHG